jgi:hypothetical protein
VASAWESKLNIIIVLVTHFCDDLIENRGYVVESQWAELFAFMKNAGFIIFLFLSLVYEYKVLNYIYKRNRVRKSKKSRYERFHDE